ncbi:uncharacterized protein LOC144875877 isoform X3 [Branchiostoma floridae x Branchiostoma japonicum]
MGWITKLVILTFFAAARIDARLQNSRMSMMIPHAAKTANDGPVIIPVQPTAYPAQTSIVGAAEPTVEQQAQCVSWSQEHYLTFDGQMYNFKGQCTYKLVGDCADNTFNIHVRHQKGCNNTQPCRVEVILYIGNFVVTLRHIPEGPAAFDGDRQLSIPANLHGLLVEKIASYVVVRSGLGFKIKWDGADAVYVEVTEELFGKTCGLCGKYDRNAHNDFTDISGKVQSHVVPFASSWRMPESEGDVCSDSRQNSHCNRNSMEGLVAHTHATQICTGLKTLPEFKPCHEFVDPFAYYEHCKEDVCLSGGLESAACNTFEAYFRECLRHGVHVNWRSDSFCPANCAEGMEYHTCGTSCPETCRTTLYDCEDNQCIDGCHCPEGTYLHGGQCLAHASCPCVSHGVEYPPGSHINSDCNDCECVSGKWECTTEPCEATCIATGDPHYITFDGRSYDFMGDCSYTMVMNRISDETDYSIEAENQECDSSSTRQLTCTRSVTVKISGTVLKLKQGKSVLLNGEDIVRLPHRGPGVYIETATSIFQKVTLDNGMRVLWDGVSRLYITAPPKFVGRTMGLCGTFNYNQQDDFYTKVGDIETNPIAFANKWKTDDMCADRPLVPTGEETMHPCDIYLQLKASAQQHCGQLMGSFFTACHNYVNPQESYDRCLFDYCGSGHSLQSMCDAMSDYSLACGAKGVELDWRQNTEGCEVSCSGELVYDQCHPGCQTTCASILEGVECQPFCVEGCACPEGTVLDYEGHCVPPEECGCMENGKHYLDGASINRGCNTCMCAKGQWACTMMDCMQESPSLCPDNQVWSNCVVENQITCKNMHLGVTSQAPITCHAGCQCRNDTVWDEETGACVLPQNCPCYHGGQSYEQSHTIQLDCNTCFCNGQQWVCEVNECAGICTTFGDPHYKTFDGKMYEFQGDCDYVLAKSKDGASLPFSVTAENIPCGTSGVTCTKNIIVTLGSGANRQRLSLVRGQPITADGTDFTIRQAGMFVFVSTPIGLTLQWDKGTRVYIKLLPAWKGYIEGLCGNFNGNQMDDFTTPMGGPPVTMANTFGDSWKVHDYCMDAVVVEDTCALHPNRQAWALRKCAILKSDIFRPCHSEVPYQPYYDKCVYDACGCDSGGDCECLCTAIAAYAQECNLAGVPIKWREQEICPMQCEYGMLYVACSSSCPKTCDNLENYSEIAANCTDTCVEGCACPPGFVVGVNGVSCVLETECFQEETTPAPPTTTASITTGTATVPTTTTMQTTTTTTPKPYTTTPPPVALDAECVQPYDYWTEWMNVGYPTPVSGGDYETIEDLRYKYVFCENDDIVSVECKVNGHSNLYAENTGQVVTCDTTVGLICNNRDQPDMPPVCYDYAIRFFCKCGELPTTTQQVTTTVKPTTTAFTTTEKPPPPTTTANTEGSTTTIHPTTTMLTTTGKTTAKPPPPTTTTFTTSSSTTTKPFSLPMECPVAGADAWTPWMNVDSPTDGDGGDYETLEALHQKYVFCEDNMITQVKCQVAGFGASAESQGQKVTCDVSTGLICINDLQLPHTCLDYEIRVFCACGEQTTTGISTTTGVTKPTTTVASTTTAEVTKPTSTVTTPKPTSTEHATTTGETTTTGTTTTTGSKPPLTTTAEVTKPTSTANTPKPTSTEHATTTGETTTTGTATTTATKPPLTTTTETTSPASETKPVQFEVTKPQLCPVPNGNAWTSWMSSGIPTQDSEGGEFETIDNLREHFSFCPNDMITDVQCSLVFGSGMFTVPSIGQTVTCNTTHGLICLNEDNPILGCRDYQVQFYCECGPESTTLTGTATSTIQPSTTGTSTTTGVTTTTTTAAGTTTAEETKPTGTATKPHPTSTEHATTTGETTTTGTATTTGTKTPSTTTVAETTTTTEEATTSGAVTTTGTKTPATSETTTTAQEGTTHKVCVDGWTTWVSSHKPNPSDSLDGDIEDLSLLALADDFNLCGGDMSMVAAIQCREIGSETPWSSTGQIGLICDTHAGFYCSNSMNYPEFCLDYEISVLCQCVPTTTQATTSTVTSTTTTLKPTTQATMPNEPPATSTAHQTTSPGTTIPTTQMTLPPLCEYPDRDFWTQWMSVGHPGNGQGDIDTIEILRTKYSFCENNMITAIDCRVISLHQTPEDEGQKVICDSQIGLICDNTDQQACMDYEVRFFCECGPGDETTTQHTTTTTVAPTTTGSQTATTTGAATTTGRTTTTGMTTTTTTGVTTTGAQVCVEGWTTWVSSHKPNPTDSTDGDFEYLNVLAHDDHFNLCGGDMSMVADIQCREIESQVPWSSTGQMGLICNTHTGFVCTNSMNEQEGCHDYEISVFCHCGETTTQQTTTTVAPTTTGSQTATTTGAATTTGRTTTTGMTTTTTTGVTTTGAQVCVEGWTTWVSSHKPNPTDSTDGDFEYLNVLAHDDHFNLCGGDMSMVADIQCREIESQVPWSSTGQLGLICNTDTGFVCTNSMNEQEACHDYEISVFCHCGETTTQQTTTTVAPTTTGSQTATTTGIATTTGRTTTTGMTTTTTGVTTTGAQVCVEGWTTWVSSHKPNPTDSTDGDFEYLNVLAHDDHFNLCGGDMSMVADIQCRETESQVPWSSTGQMGLICNTDTGFVCTNSMNEQEGCYDYEISVFCHCGETTTQQTTSTVETTTTGVTTTSGVSPSTGTSTTTAAGPVATTPLMTTVKPTGTPHVPENPPNQPTEQAEVTTSGTASTTATTTSTGETTTTGKATTTGETTTAGKPTPTSTVETTTTGTATTTGVTTSTGETTTTAKQTPTTTSSVETTTTAGQTSTAETTTTGTATTTSETTTTAKQTPTSTAAITTTIAQTTECKNQWTTWMNSGKPASNGLNGDYETLTNLQQMYEFCSADMIVDVECRVADGFNTPVDQVNQIVTCDIKDGLICMNEYQTGPLGCFDYEIRFFCRCGGPTTTMLTTSQTSRPTSTTITTTASVSTPTVTPTIHTQPPTPSTTPAQQILVGCEHQYPYWTQWMSVNTPSPSTEGDSETIQGLRPYYRFCDEGMIVDVQCRVTGSSMPASQTGQTVTCDASVGLTCLNADQAGPFHLCDDYEVRFFCACGETTMAPTTTHVTTTATTETTTTGVTTTTGISTTTGKTPSTTTGVTPTTAVQTGTNPSDVGVSMGCLHDYDYWTEWMNIDSPASHDGDDVEFINNLREEYTFCGPFRVEDVECRVSGTHLSAEEGGQKVTCDEHVGLICHAEDQDPNSGILECYDYEIRFLCDCGVETTPPAIPSSTSTVKTTTTATTSSTGISTTTGETTTTGKETPTTTAEIPSSTTTTTAETTTTVATTSTGVTTSTGETTTTGKETPTTTAEIPSSTTTTTAETTTTVATTSTGVTTSTGETTTTGKETSTTTAEIPSSTTTTTAETTTTVATTSTGVTTSTGETTTTGKETPTTTAEIPSSTTTTTAETTATVATTSTGVTTSTGETTTTGKTTTTSTAETFTTGKPITTTGTTTTTAETTTTGVSTTTGVTTPGKPTTMTTTTKQNQPEGTSPLPTTLPAQFGPTGGEEEVTFQPTGPGWNTFPEGTEKPPILIPHPPTPVPTQVLMTTLKGCEADVDYWTPWMNVFYPTHINGGDFETLDNLRDKYMFCDNGMIVSVECRTVDDHTPSDQSGQKVICSIDDGLICSNDMNTEDCHDYEIRFFCDCGVEPTTIVSAETTTTTQAPTTGVTTTTGVSKPTTTISSTTTGKETTPGTYSTTSTQGSSTTGVVTTTATNPVSTSTLLTSTAIQTSTVSTTGKPSPPTTTGVSPATTSTISPTTGHETTTGKTPPTTSTISQTTVHETTTGKTPPTTSTISPTTVHEHETTTGKTPSTTSTISQTTVHETTTGKTPTTTSTISQTTVHETTTGKTPTTTSTISPTTVHEHETTTGKTPPTTSTISQTTVHEHETTTGKTPTTTSTISPTTVHEHETTTGKTPSTTSTISPTTVHETTTGKTPTTTSTISPTTVHEHETTTGKTPSTNSTISPTTVHQTTTGKTPTTTSTISQTTVHEHETTTGKTPTTTSTISPTTVHEHETTTGKTPTTTSTISPTTGHETTTGNTPSTTSTISPTTGHETTTSSITTSTGTTISTTTFATKPTSVFTTIVATKPVPPENPAMCLTNTNYWTEWMNTGSPNSGEGGDMESIDSLREQYIFCDQGMMAAVQCRVVGTNNLMHNQVDQNVTCSILQGLECHNMDQPADNYMCHDYEIRFFCQCGPEATTTMVTTARPTTALMTTPVIHGETVSETMPLFPVTTGGKPIPSTTGQISTEKPPLPTTTAAKPTTTAPLTTFKPTTVPVTTSTMSTMRPFIVLDTCIMFDDTLQTFDGTVYDYPICNNVLAKDCVHNRFEVHAFLDCTGADNRDDCNRGLYVRVGEDVIILDRPSHLTLNGQAFNLTQLPTLNNNLANRGIQISAVGNEIIIQTNYGINIYWSKTYEARIVVHESLQNMLCGMCGTYNHQSQDDFTLQDASLTDDAIAFGDNWMMGECPFTSTAEHVCPPEIEAQAEAKCDVLRTSVFSACHPHVPIDLYYHLCVNRVCECHTNGTDLADCECDILSAYATTCERLDEDIVLDWRNPLRCPAECPPGMVYHECGPGCPLTCDNMHDPNVDCNVECVSGCFCPDNMVQQGDQCIRPSLCTDCYCYGYGDPHYITFDGTYYPFQGQCSYVLARETTTHEFEVIGDNELCDGGPNPTCTKAVTVRYGGHEVTLKRNRIVSPRSTGSEVTVDGVDQSAPVSIGGINVHLDGLKLVLEIPAINLRVRFDEINHGFDILVPSSVYYDRTEGLCGPCNHDGSDDLTTSQGTIETNTDIFALSWLTMESTQQTEIQCGLIESTSPSQTECTADFSQCEVILSDVFEECHQLVNPQVFLDTCKYDVCNVGLELSCDSLAAYARECDRHGVCLEWREGLCEFHCPAAMEFHSCGAPCPMTCDMVTGLTPVVPCNTTETEGCFCPPHMVLDHNGDCVAPESCPMCVDETGRPFALGDTWHPNNDPCETCTCKGLNSTICVQKVCPQFPNDQLVCRSGHKVPVVWDEDHCCQTPQYDECMTTVDCTDMETCQAGEVMDTSQNGTCYCRCVPEECPSPVMPTLSEGQMAVPVDAHQCCPEYTAVCNNSMCSDKIPGQFEVLVEVEGQCCPQLMCDSSLCPIVPTCSPHQTLQTTEGHCCKEYQCVCDETLCPVPPSCQDDEVLVSTVGECCTTYECSCDKTQCEDTIPACPVSGMTAVVTNAEACCSQYECTCQEPMGVHCHDLTCPHGFMADMVNLNECGCPTTCVSVCGSESCYINGSCHSSGDMWTPDDVCTVCSCKPNNGAYEAMCETQVCAACPAGYTMVDMPDQCCGECTKTDCVVMDAQSDQGFILYQPGDEWVQNGEDQCNKEECKCVEQNGMVSEVCYTQTCPSVANCPEEFIMWDEQGCCQICQEPPSGSCSAELVEGHPQLLTVGACVTTMPVNITQCAGHCPSFTTVTFPNDLSFDSAYNHECQCCQPSKSERRTVDLMCEDGTLQQHSYDYIQECTCDVSKCLQWGTEPETP